MKTSSTSEGEKWGRISYADLAGRVGDMVMMNNANEIDEDLYSNLENGSMYYETEEGEEEDTDGKEIYQLYHVTRSGAEYLKENTDELVFYSRDMDAYFWGITHFGTSWDGVFTKIKS